MRNTRHSLSLSGWGAVGLLMLVTACGASSTTAASATSGASPAAATSSAAAPAAASTSSVAAASSPSSASAAVISGAPSSATSAAGDDAVTKAQAIVDAASKEPTAIKQTVPLTGKVKPGLTYVFLQCELQQCKEVGDGAEEAATALGWTTKRINWSTSDPATLISALKQALQYNPVAVTPTAYPQALWASVIPDYQKAGVLIVPASVGYLTISKTVPGGAFIAPDYRTDGETIGSWFIADSKAKGHALSVGITAFEVLKASSDGTVDAIKTNCPNCAVTSLDLTTAQLGSNGAVPAIVAALQKDPSITYVLTSNGAFLSGLPAALKAAGLNGIKIAGNAPNSENLQDLVSGTESAWTGETIVESGWQVIDIAARASLGMTVQPGDGGRVTQLLLQSNVGTPTPSLEKPAGYRNQYKKLWLLS